MVYDCFEKLDTTRSFDSLVASDLGAQDDKRTESNEDSTRTESGDDTSDR